MSKLRFQRAKPIVDFAATEREISKFWDEHRIFDKSLKLREGCEPFIFNEGPPTANGLPHNGHVLTRVFKDIFLRYRTMAGRYVPRKAGWDTHGLPVEVEVEKELGIHGKEAIEEYGVERFIGKCMDSVFRYIEEWEDMTRRVGFWVDLSDAYVTYHKSYVESVWWALSRLFQQGLLYRGHKIVWWWPQGGTALSAGEVGLGYKTVEDPSVYVALPLADDPSTSLLVWTTTPWTLPANQYVAVRPDYDYVKVRDGDRLLILAAALRETLEQKLGHSLPVEEELKGEALLGLRYHPPFEHFKHEYWTKEGALKFGDDREHYLWKVLAGDFVTLDSGTGLVHQAPAFGEVDYDVHKETAERYVNPDEVPLLRPVQPDGTFDATVTEVAGQWVKDADRVLIRMLRDSGSLVHRENYRHDYPFCWRADEDPLIQYARPAWFVRTTARNKQVLANNDKINWLPEHIGTGRFGDFLRNNIDWALSRERYWGTPLNVWINDVTGAMAVPASCDEILSKNPAAFDHFHRAKAADPSLSDHLMVHKPWIDEVTWTEPGEDGVYRRVPEVIDCWFDSGCMPFAQFGFPHKGRQDFESRFPADYITEAIDQTRGWFYSQLMVSTLVFDEDSCKDLGIEPPAYPHPFRNCIVLGHVADPTGKKESKSLGNYTPPEVIFDNVAQDFAVMSPADAPRQGSAGEALMSKQDLEALDLKAGDKVSLAVCDSSSSPLDLAVRPAKFVPRRSLLLSAQDLEAIGAKVAGTGQVVPNDVPRLPADERVTLSVPTPAPGADAFRWFFFAGNPPWSPTRHSLANVRMIQKEFPLKLRNVYSFFTIYADIDGFDPNTTPGRPAAERSLLDRWILSELDILAGRVRQNMDAYLVYEAASELGKFVDGLSNWYVRRSRERFWKGEFDADKADAYATLYECLVSVAKLSAAFTPFMAEEIYQNLVCGADVTGPESVHLCDLPSSSGRVDHGLSEEMAAVRGIVSLGLRVRTDHQLKVRQPLRKAEVVIADPDLRERVEPYSALVEDELNVHDAVFVDGEQAHVNYLVKPNFRRLGPRLGPKMKQAKRIFAELDAAKLRASLLANDSVTIDFDGEDLILDGEDVQVSVEAEASFAAAGDSTMVAVLSTELDDELRDEGFYRELLHRVQNLRKTADIEYTRRIELFVEGSERTERIVAQNREHLMAETLCTKLAETPASGAEPISEAFQIDGEQVRLEMLPL